MSSAHDKPPMRVCFLGCGQAASQHSAAAHSLGAAVQCSYASRSIDRARAINATRKGAGAYGSYGEALASPSVDVIAVVTPPVSHLELTLAALEQGKDVILEKPPLLSSRDFDRVERACRERGRFVYVAENYFYKPLVATLRTTLASGAIGEPIFIQLNAARLQRAAGWRDAAAEAGGGALFEGGIHWVNFAGALGYTIRTVKAVRPGPPGGLDRSMALLFEYAEGPAGMLWYSWEVASPLRGVRSSRIYGREGGIVFESNGLFVATYGRRWRLEFPAPGDLLGRKAMYADFLRAWRERAEPSMTLARARRDLELVEEAYRSAGIAGPQPS